MTCTPQGRAPTPTTGQRPARGRGAAVAIGLAGALLCSCSDPPSNPTTGPTATAPAAQACLGDTDRPTDQPLSNAATDAKTSTLSPTPVTGAGYSWSGGDTVYSLQVITDFPVPAGVVAATDDVVLASYSVNTTYPGGWNPSQSLQATAFSKENGIQLLTRSCPSQAAPILDAMRAAGHVPLPDHIPAGQTVTGWAAFVVPRTVTDLTMRVQHVSPEGGGAASYPLLHIPHPSPPHALPDGDLSMTADLIPELALEIGGWDIRYARVLVIALAGDAGISIIDPNGDGNMTEIEHVYRDDAGRWCAGSSGGGGTPDLYGEHGSGFYSGGGHHGVRYVYGRAEKPGPQTVSGRSGRFEVTAAHTGWWAWVQAIPDE